MALLARLRDFFIRPVVPQGIVDLYTACVMQARQPDFYLAGVPDTVDGRFDLIILHIYLVMNKLQGRDEDKQQLFDLMFSDMDRSLREMGVGDMSIRKKMRPMIAAFYGRATAYDDALAKDDGALAEVIQRNVFGAIAADPAALKALVAYVRQAVIELAGQNADDLVAGRVRFPVAAVMKRG